jgi:hypothetical protein
MQKSYLLKPFQEFGGGIKENGGGGKFKYDICDAL